MPGRYKKGDRYGVREALTACVLTTPFTGGYEKVIPQGLKFVVAFNPPARASAVAATVEPSSEWEALLVEAEDRADPKYGGFYLSIPLKQVEKHCVRLPVQRVFQLRLGHL